MGHGRMILLDTHALVWLHEANSSLDAPTIKKINTAFLTGMAAISAVTVFSHLISPSLKSYYQTLCRSRCLMLACERPSKSVVVVPVSFIIELNSFYSSGVLSVNKLFIKLGLYDTCSKGKRQ